MTWRGNRQQPRCRQAGATLLEALIVIAILAVALTLSAGRMGGPSDRLQLASAAASLSQSAAVSRARAILIGEPVAFHPKLDSRTPVALGSCDSLDRQPSGKIIFTPDGRAEGPPFCLYIGDVKVVLRVDWMTGLIRSGELEG